MERISNIVNAQMLKLKRQQEAVEDTKALIALLESQRKK